VKLRIEVELPMCENAMTDKFMAEPTLQSPCTLMEEPNREYPRRLIAEPKLVKSNADSAEPSLVVDLMLSVEPRCKQSTTDIEDPNRE
jgi:hypothetical protein